MHFHDQYSNHYMKYSCITIIINIYNLILILITFCIVRDYKLFYFHLYFVLLFFVFTIDA